MKYQGYSYPKILQNPFVWFLWKKFQCPKGNHLWDEVKELDRHYFYCDACDKEVFIDGGTYDNS